MAKFSGKIGFLDTIETKPGIWEDKLLEKKYYGDIVRNMSRWESSSSINGSIALNNSFSIVADPYAKENFQKMKYICYLGIKWKIENIEVQYPRLILTVGGEYNE